MFNEINESNQAKFKDVNESIEATSTEMISRMKEVNKILNDFLKTRYDITAIAAALNGKQFPNASIKTICFGEDDSDSAFTKFKRVTADKRNKFFKQFQLNSINGKLGTHPHGRSAIQNNENKLQHNFYFSWSTFKRN